ncbi:MAG: rhomboid family intramembrane serine protease [Bauldia sp.]|nr:rhomboid family intramembrane serine protease [Bauldia sp.]
MFPIHDGRELTHVARPYATWAIILVNVAVYFVFEGGLGGDVSFAAVYGFGLIPATYNDYFELPPDILAVPDWLTLVTYAFLHADFWHLLGNMVFLWVFADNIEDAFGHLRFVLFYLLCAAGAGLVFVLSDPDAQTPLVGASGAIAGVVAAYLMLHPRQRIWVLVLMRIPLRLPAFWVLGFWVVFQFYSILVAQPGEQVAWWAHVGGLITGALLVLVMRRRGVPLFDRGSA